ncbi:hypothetical protein [Streptomyces sp. NPDC005438]|uniref:hypothetical protein n=1 Tax=Streptomyces sp. NPDC005438 TaxID=3156880 RepID=UPI00339E3EAB
MPDGNLSTPGGPARRTGRTRWGRVNFGGGGLPALWVAAPCGALLATGFAALAVATGVVGERPLVGGVVFALVSVWALIGLVWVLVVDRSTLRGATERPEESVESAWFDTAARGSFTDSVTFVGLALAALAVTGVELSAVVALAGVLVFAALTFAVRFLLVRRQG